MPLQIKFGQLKKDDISLPDGDESKNGGKKTVVQ